MLLTVLWARWRENTCAEAVIKDANVARRISVERRVVTAGRFLRVYNLKTSASPVTEVLEVARVSKNIRRTNWKATQSAKRSEIAPSVTCAWRERITNVSNRFA